MIKIITIIYVFLSYVLFDQQLKITFRKSPPPPPEKIHSPLKIQKVQAPLFANTENFSDFPEKGSSIVTSLTILPKVFSSRRSHRRCFIKKVFLKISQISQNTCARVSSSEKRDSGTGAFL